MMLVSSAVFSAVVAGQPKASFEDEDEDEDEQRNRVKILAFGKDWTEEEFEDEDEDEDNQQNKMKMSSDQFDHVEYHKAVKLTQGEQVNTVPVCWELQKDVYRDFDSARMFHKAIQPSIFNRVRENKIEDQFDDVEYQKAVYRDFDSASMFCNTGSKAIQPSIFNRVGQKKHKRKKMESKIIRLEALLEDEDLEDEDEQRNKWKMSSDQFDDQDGQGLDVKFHHSQLVVSVCFSITNSLEQWNKMKMNNGTLLVQRKMEVGKDWTEEEFEDEDEDEDITKDIIDFKLSVDQPKIIRERIHLDFERQEISRDDFLSMIEHDPIRTSYSPNRECVELDMILCYGNMRPSSSVVGSLYFTRLEWHTRSFFQGCALGHIPRFIEGSEDWSVIKGPADCSGNLQHHEFKDAVCVVSTTSDGNGGTPPVGRIQRRLNTFKRRQCVVTTGNTDTPYYIARSSRIVASKRGIGLWTGIPCYIITRSFRLLAATRRRRRPRAPPLWIYDTGSSISVTGDLSLLPGVCSTGDCSPFLGLRRADPVSAANGQSISSNYCGRGGGVVVNLSQTAPQTTGLISSSEPIAADNSSLLTPDTTPEQTWRVASAAPQHMTGYLNHLIDYTPASGDQVIDTPNMGRMAVHGRGSVNTANITLQDVLYVPCLDANLVSTGQLAQLGYMITLGPYGCRIYKDDEDMPLVGEAHYVDGYLLELDFLRVRPSTN